MITWIRENAWLASILTGAVIAVSTVAVSRYQLSGLVASQPAVESHIHDTTRHIDPNRDPQSQKALIDRIEKLEERLNRLEGRRGDSWRQRRGERNR